MRMHSLTTFNDVTGIPTVFVRESYRIDGRLAGCCRAAAQRSDGGGGWGGGRGGLGICSNGEIFARAILDGARRNGSRAPWRVFIRMRYRMKKQRDHASARERTRTRAMTILEPHA